MYAGGHKPTKQELHEWFTAAKTGNLNLIKVLSLLINENTKDKDGNTALIIAAAEDQKKVVIFLLQIDGIDVNAQNKKGDTALIEACAKNYGSDSDHGIVTLLLNAPNINVNLKNNDGRTALMRTLFFGNNEIGRLLLAAPGIDVNAKDSDGNTALILACSKGEGFSLPETDYATTVKILLTAPNIDVNAQNNRGTTPLLWAIWHEDIILHILDAPDLKLNLKNKLGVNARMLASQLDDVETINLIDQKIAALKLKHKSALFQALEQNNIELVQNLVTLIDGTILELIDDQGNTPLHYAFKSNNVPLAIFVLQQVKDPREVLAFANNNGTLPLELINPTSPIFKLCLDLAFIQKKGPIARLSKFIQNLKTKKETGAKTFSKKCGLCSSSGCSLRCATCKKVYYCSEKCQKGHWGVHKHICKQ